MRTSAHEYNDIIIRMPQSADSKPLKAFVEAMGWQLVTHTADTDTNAIGGLTDAEQPSKKLRGLFKMPAGFDYKASLHQVLKEGYGI